MAEDNTAVYSAAISAAAEGANMISAAGNSKKARKHASEENQKSRDWNLQMWEKNNAWNEHITDPQYKMDRLKAAGINPHLAYSNGSDFANPTSAAPAQGTSPMVPNVPQSYAIRSEPMLNALMMQAQIANINADTKSKEANTDRTTTLNGIDMQTLDNMSNVIDQENTLRDISIQSGKLNLDLTVENVQKTKQEITNLITTNDSIRQGIQESITRMGLNEAQTAQYIANLAVIRETVKQIQSQTSLNYERGKTERTNRNYTNQQTESARRGNYIGEKYDLNNAENNFQKNSTDVKTAVQMLQQAETTNKILDKKVTTQQYQNDIMLLESVEKAGTLPANIGKAYMPWTKGGQTTTRFNSEGEYNGHSTTRNHR